MGAAPASARQRRWTGRQFHNQPEASHTHGFLAALWEEVDAETAGELRVRVHARNGGVAGSDPGALAMLVAGELEFMTLMGGILGQVVPVAEIQGLPFAFGSHAQVHRVMQGELGDHVREAMAAKGIHGFRHGVLENGFRHIVSIDRPVRTAADLDGYRMRIPAGRVFEDLFRSLGAQPVVVNIDELYARLAERAVDGQENPLVVTEVNRLYEVQVRQPDRAHVVGVQPDRQLRVLAAAARERAGNRRPRGLEAQPAPARLHRPDQPRARDQAGDRTRARLQHRGRRDLPARTRRRLLPPLERGAGRNRVGPAREGSRPAGPPIRRDE